MNLKIVIFPALYYLNLFCIFHKYLFVLENTEQVKQYASLVPYYNLVWLCKHVLKVYCMLFYINNTSLMRYCAWRHGYFNLFEFTLLKLLILKLCFKVSQHPKVKKVTYPCYKIYMIEAVGLSISNYTFKINFFVCEVLGHFVKNYIMSITV